MVNPKYKQTVNGLSGTIDFENCCYIASDNDVTV